MKKLVLNYKMPAAPAELGQKIVPGVFDILGGLKSGDYTGAVVVLNHIPNDKIEDNRGYNIIAIKDGQRFASMKRNPLYNPNELPAPRPEVPEYVPCNYRTVEEALIGYDNVDLIEIV